MLTIRVATDDDFRTFYEREPPEVWHAMCGDRDGIIAGIAGVVYGEDGVAIGFLDATERPSFALHRAAKRFLAVMKAVGEKAIYTSCEDSIPRAEEWLIRLGFKLLPGEIEGQRIWRWTPH